MKIEESYVQNVTLTLSHDVISGYNEVEPFISILKKLKKEVKKSGFRKTFNKEESDFILYLHDNIVKEEDEESKDKRVYKDNNKEI